MTYDKDIRVRARRLIDRLKGSEDPEKQAEGMTIEHLFNEAYGYECPKCGKVSHHPEDLKHRYCAACHEFERL